MGYGIQEYKKKNKLIIDPYYVHNEWYRYKNKIKRKDLVPSS